MKDFFAWLFKKQPERPVAFAPDPDTPPIDKDVQQRLKELNYYDGPVNGWADKATQAAVIAFKRKHGLNPRFLIGPVTREYLFKGPPKKNAQPPKSDRPWMKIAKSMNGMREIKGRLHNEKIVSMWDVIGAGWFNDDETPWCGAFVGYCLITAGVMTRGKGSARARGYENHPELIQLNKPVPGCLVTMWRKSINSGNGHVCFADGFDERGRLMGFGGNQSDAVNTRPFDLGRITGYWWPKGVPVPTGKDAKMPLISSGSSKSSNNEA